MIGFLWLLSAIADPPDLPSSCYDSVLIDLTGIGDEPTCWFVDGNGTYTAPVVTAGQLQVRELPDGRVFARCRAALPNDHGHAVHWHAANACETDPEVLCEIGLADGSAVSTSSWHLGVGPRGHAVLTCGYFP